LSVVDEPVELCVTRLRYAQIHGISRLAVEDISSPPGRDKNLLSLRVKSGHPDDAQRPAIRVSLTGHPSCRATVLRAIARNGTKKAASAAIFSPKGP
jgi:hypothetical protein